MHSVFNKTLVDVCRLAYERGRNPLPEIRGIWNGSWHGGSKDPTLRVRTPLFCVNFMVNDPNTKKLEKYWVCCDNLVSMEEFTLPLTRIFELAYNRGVNLMPLMRTVFHNYNWFGGPGNTVYNPDIMIDYVLFRAKKPEEYELMEYFVTITDKSITSLS